MGFFDSIKKGFSKAASKVTGVVKSVANAVADGGKKVYNGAEHFVSGVVDQSKIIAANIYKDGKNAISWTATTAAETAQTVIKQPAELAKHIADKASEFGKSAASSLSMPLVIGVAIVGGILLLGKTK